MSQGRAQKAGDAYHIEKKLEQKYDEQEALGTPGRIIEWITAAMGGDITACGGTSCKDIHTWLMDGVVLCKLMNKLNAAAGLGKVGFKSKAGQSFIAMNNIENFNAGCRAYGVPETALFQTTDLYEGRKGPMVNVINCLSQLGFVANEKGFNPAYRAPEAPKLDM